MIKVAAVSVLREGRAIVDEVDLTIDEGDHVAIIGPNGAGKTTLLRCIAGMITPNAGTIQIDGEAISRMTMRERAQHIAYVMQVHEPPPPLPVRDFVLMARYAYMPAWGGYSKEDEAKAIKAIDTVEMTPFADRLMNTLSGGECQKIYLAAALAQDAPIILLDEPATHLDYRHQYEITNLIDTVHAQENRTVVTVTHDLNLGAPRAKRIIAMTEGRIAFDGEAGDLSPQVLESIFDLPFETITRADGSVAALPVGDAK